MEQLNDNSTAQEVTGAPSSTESVAENLASTASDLTSTPAIRFEALEPRVLLSGDVNPAAFSIAGSLDAPGQQNHYTFTVQDTHRVVFDSMTNRSDMHWTLTGPNGQITTHTFASTDGPYTSTTAFDLDPGTYSVTVDGDDKATGAYAMRIIDADTALDLQPGNKTTGSLSQGDETSVYRFDAIAGQKFSMAADSIVAASGSASIGWRLIDPYGRQEQGASSLSSDPATFTAQYTGQYLVLLEGAVGNTEQVDYSFTLNPFADIDSALDLGQEVNNSVGTLSGQVANYHFTVDTDTSVVFDKLGGNDFYWSLTGPDGQITYSYTNQNYYDNPAGVALAAGNYTLTIGNGTAFGGYAFRLLDTSSAQAVSLNSSVDASLANSRNTDLYKVSLEQGQQLYLTGTLPGGGNLYWSLLDANGQKIAGNTLTSNTASFSVSQSGDYWLAMSGYNYNTAGSPVAYHFALNLVPDLTADVTLGSVSNGSVALAGQRTVYGFHLAQATQLAFDSLTSRADLLWSLRGPRGLEIDHRNFSQSVSATISALPAGDYTLTVEGQYAAVGDYAFIVQDLGASSLEPLGEAISGTLNPGNGMTAYRLVAQAGDSLQLQNGSVSAGQASWRLIDPYGRDVSGSRNLLGTTGAITASVDGSYTLLIEGAIANTAPVDFTAMMSKVGYTAPAPLPDGDALTLGRVTAGVLSSSADTKVYRFSLAAATNLAFDGQSSSSARWSLVGPRGVEVSGQYTSSDSVLALPAGDYALTLQSGGSYAFQLIDLASFPTLQPGQPTTATRSPASSTVGYRIDAVAGKPLLLNVDSQGGGYYGSTWSLIDEFGQAVVSVAGDNLGKIFNISHTGTYTLLDIGSQNATGSANDTFTISELEQSTDSLALNEVISDTLNGRQSTASYSFDIREPTPVVFGALFGATGIPPNAQWLIRGPLGNVTNWNNLTSNPSMKLVAGHYTLVLRNVSDAAATYHFRLMDRDAGLDLTLDQPTTLSLGSFQSQILRFDAAAGDHLYFSGNSQNEYRNWQLIDHLGNNVANGNTRYDSIDVPVSVTGEYLLVFSPIDMSNVVATDTFTVGKHQTTTAPLTLGEDVTGDIVLAGQSIQYSFTLPSPTTLVMNPRQTASLKWSLTGPRGAEVSSRNFQNGAYVGTLPVGTYTLKVSRTDLDPGTFAFTLADLGALPTLPFGEVATATSLGSENTNPVFALDVPVEGDYAIDVPSLNYARWLLVDARGQIRANSNNNSGVIHLAKGRYALIWSTYETSIASVDFTPLAITTARQALVIGTAVSGEITVPGQRFEYDFSINAPTQAIFDSLSDRSDITWQLSGPSGQVVNGTALNQVGADGTVKPINLADIGDYRLTIVPTHSTVGGFSFNLLTYATATALSLEASQAVSLEPGNSTALYRVDGDAGDYLSLDIASITGGQVQAWLTDVHGVRVQLPVGLTASGKVRFALPHAGSYFLAIEGAAGNSTSVSMALKTALISPHHSVLTIGEDISGITTGTEVPDQWQFSVATPSRVLVDGPMLAT